MLVYLILFAIKNGMLEALDLNIRGPGKDTDRGVYLSFSDNTVSIGLWLSLYRNNFGF